MNTTALSASTAVPDASSPLDVALTHMVKHSFPLRIRVLKIRHLHYMQICPGGLEGPVLLNFLCGCFT